MRIRVLNPSDVEPLLAFLARAEVAVCRVLGSVIEVQPKGGRDAVALKQEVALLLGVWKAMHPESGFAWA
jgi:hypothetical protein